MKKISSFFDRFFKIIKDDSFLKSALAEAISEKTGIAVNPENIEIKGGNAYLKENHGVKNEVFLNKKNILAEFEKITGKNLKNIF